MARVLESVVWYVFRFADGVTAVFGAEVELDWTVRRLPSSMVAEVVLGGSFGAFNVIGGGRFFPLAGGACRVGIG